MAKNRQPIAKRCKALGISPAVMGYSKKTTIRNPGNGMRRKQSEYATQLKEKQKLKFIYGVLEHQFASYFDMAERQTGMTGENLLRLLERRLDNVVFRLGKKVNIPSYLVKPGDVIAVREASRSSVKFSKLTGADAPLVTTPEWMERNKEALEGKILRMPERSDIEFEVEEHLIVELYSK